MKHTDIPDGPHWAIISTRSTLIPGDARSRSAPGHGYPEHTVHNISYEVFHTEGELRDQVDKRVAAGRFRKDFICIHVDKTVKPKIKAVIDWNED